MTAFRSSLVAHSVDLDFVMFCIVLVGLILEVTGRRAEDTGNAAAQLSSSSSSGGLVETQFIPMRAF
jgi:hypothetical protein